MERSYQGLIQFKDSAVWKQADSDLKEVLSRRENIPSKKERKEIRQARANFVMVSLKTNSKQFKSGKIQFSDFAPLHIIASQTLPFN